MGTRHKLLHSILLSILGSLFLCFNVFAADDLTIYFLDVGQADCSLYVQGEHTMLVDAGNNGDGKEVVEFIKSKGIKKLDYVIGTHPHEDHIGGLDDVLNNFEVGTLFMSEKATTTKTFRDVVDAIKVHKIKLVAPSVRKEFMLGEARVKVLTDKTKVDNNTTDLNSASLGVLVSYADRTVLSCGDLDKAGEEVMLDNFSVEELNTDVYKVSHHGSRTASSAKFLDGISAEYSIIQTETDNSYGHPHEEVLKRLTSRGSKVYRNDLNGTITLHISKDGNLIFNLEKDSLISKDNTESTVGIAIDYVLNTLTKKIHTVDCNYAKRIKDDNKQIVSSFDFVGSTSYTKCSYCLQ